MRKFEALPERMQCDEVKEYYYLLSKHKGSLVLKRVFDFIIALILLVVLSPIFLILCALVGFTSKGGVFYRQVRITTYGKEFSIIKFRTMVSGADKMGSLVTTNGDSRVTKVGRFLRKVRLDELPQLLNILAGQMSIVGTRPEVPRYVDQYSREMLATLLLPAGVTSKASIMYKDEERLLSQGEDVDHIYVHQVLPQKMKYNLDYVKSFTFWGDIKLMFQTVIAVLK
jgi:lipopolysaccharide/colanic/teichoic acid biosynthesis glycosyltransferase